MLLKQHCFLKHNAAIIKEILHVICIFYISNWNIEDWLLFISLSMYMLSRYTPIKLRLYIFETFNNPVKTNTEPMMQSHIFALKKELVIFWVYICIVFVAQTFFYIIDVILMFSYYNLCVQTCFKSNSFDLVPIF